MLLLHDAGAAEQLVQRQHRVVSRVIGVMTGRPVGHLVAVTHSVIVGNRDRLVVRHQEAILRAGRRAPRTHARVGARLVEIDRRAAAFLVGAGIGGQPLFMGAPAEFRRLHAFRKEAFDRPGVDEHIARLRVLGDLGVAFGDVHALHAERLGELGPAFARRRRIDRLAEIAGDVEQCLLDEPRHHAGVGPAGGDRRRAAGIAAARRQHGFAQRVVGTRFRPQRRVEIEARPRLHDRVDVEHVEFTGELHERHRRRIDRQVHAEALAFAAGQQRGQQFAVIVLRHRRLDIANAPLVEQRAIGIIGIDDDETAAVEGEVTLDERQGPLADGAEADHHDGAGDRPVNRPVGH